MTQPDPALVAKGLTEAQRGFAAPRSHERARACACPRNVRKEVTCHPPTHRSK